MFLPVCRKTYSLCACSSLFRDSDDEDGNGLDEFDMDELSGEEYVALMFRLRHILIYQLSQR